MIDNMHILRPSNLEKIAMPTQEEKKRTSEARTGHPVQLARF